MVTKANKKESIHHPQIEPGKEIQNICKEEEWMIKNHSQIKEN